MPTVAVQIIRCQYRCPHKRIIRDFIVDENQTYSEVVPSCVEDRCVNSGEMFRIDRGYKVLQGNLTLEEGEKPAPFYDKVTRKDLAGSTAS